MKTLDYIPTNKIERASKLVATGFKVGGNYLKYYGEKAVNGTGTKLLSMKTTPKTSMKV